VKIVIKRRAQINLAKVAEWISEQYFVDTAMKWLDELSGILKKLLRLKLN
jgi:hypothetical protein